MDERARHVFAARRMAVGGLPRHPEQTQDHRDGRERQDQAAERGHGGRLAAGDPAASQGGARTQPPEMGDPGLLAETGVKNLATTYSRTAAGLHYHWRLRA